MNYCRSGSKGTAGVVRMYSAGTIDALLDSLQTLRWEDYHENPEAIAEKIEQHVAQRAMTQDERKFLFSTMSLVGNDEIILYRSETRGGVRMDRAATTFKGHVENKFPANYVRDKTPTAKEFNCKLKAHLDASDEELGCVHSQSHLLGWPNILRDLVHRRYECLRRMFMWQHADHNDFDTADDGTPNWSTIRGVNYFGKSSILFIHMKLVWAVPTGKTLPNGKLEYVEKVKQVGRCEISLRGLLGVYFLSNIGAGRQPGWAMRDPADGLTKAVVLYHEIRCSNGPSICDGRGIIVTDRTFATAAEANQHFANARHGNPAPYNFVSDHFSFDLSPFGDDDVTAARRIDEILQSASIFEPPPRDHQARAGEALSGLTEWNSTEVYSIIMEIFSSNGDGSDVAPGSARDRWLTFKKRRKDDELFHLLEDVRARGHHRNGHQARADEAFSEAELTELNATEVYDSIMEIFSLNTDGSDVCAGTVGTRWGAFKKRHQSHHLFHHLEAVRRARSHRARGPSDQQAREDEAFTELTELNATEIYNSIQEILSSNTDGSDMAPRTVRDRWCKFKKRHEDHELFHLLEEVHVGHPLIRVVNDDPYNEDDHLDALLRIDEMGGEQSEEVFTRRWAIDRTSEWREQRKRRRDVIERCEEAVDEFLAELGITPESSNVDDSFVDVCGSKPRTKRRKMSEDERAKREAKRAERVAEQERKRAEQERKRAEREAKRAEQERKRAEREAKRAEREAKRAEQERKRAERDAEQERKRAEREAKRERKLAERECKKAAQERKRAEQEADSKNGHQARADEAFAELTERSADDVYGSINDIFSSNTDGSDVAPDTVGKRWRTFKKRHKDHHLIHLLEEVHKKRHKQRLHQVRADEAFAELTDSNAADVYGSINDIFSSNTDGSDVAPLTADTRWHSFKGRHKDHELFHLLEEVRSGHTSAKRRKTSGKEERNRSKRVTVTITKPSKDANLGLGLRHKIGSKVVRVVRVDDKVAGGLFSHTDLEVGMFLESVNGQRYTTIAECCALLKNAIGKVTIVAVE